MVCGTVGRPCPKLVADVSRVTIVGPYSLPPPCLYVLPSTIPSPRNNPTPQPQRLSDVQIMQAFNDCFRCTPEEINYVSFDVAHRDADTVRTTRIVRDNAGAEGIRPDRHPTIVAMTSEQRSRTMRAVKGRDTKPELAVRAAPASYGLSVQAAQERTCRVSRTSCSGHVARSSSFTDVSGTGTLASAGAVLPKANAELLAGENCSQRRTLLRPTRRIDCGRVDGAYAMGVRACRRGCGCTPRERLP